jgi:Fe-Mn family superoxide dismutase
MYKEHSFSFGNLQGISQKTIDTHLALYAGYVKNTNLILEKIKEYSENPAEHAYAINELQRRFSFEWNGMRNHEFYFKSLEGGALPLKDGALKSALEENFGSFDIWLSTFKTIAATRGVGWAILYYDTFENKLVHAWVDEQHIGHLNSATYILGIDMWEHAFILDYSPKDKSKYIEVYFNNLNWNVMDENFTRSLAHRIQ